MNIDQINYFKAAADKMLDLIHSMEDEGLDCETLWESYFAYDGAAYSLEVWAEKN